MSNGAGAAKGNLARAAADSAPHGPIGDAATGPSDAGLMGLLFDDPMDGDGALGAAQISQTQIIERQAETIARLERHAARDKEYRTVTKVKLKEAAARLKEYRLRVEALLEEAEVTKQTIARLEAEKKKALAQAAKKPAVAAKKAVEMVTVAVQTPWKTAVRTVSVQTDAVRTRAMEVQTDEVIAATLYENERPESGIQLKPVTTNGVTAVASSTSAFDAIGAAIDAELDFSDDDEVESDDKSAPVTEQPIATQTALTPSQLILDDAISREIDNELNFSSSDEDEIGDGDSGAGRDSACQDEPTPTTPVHLEKENIMISNDGVLDASLTPSLFTKADKPTPEIHPPICNADAISQAIDDELASDSDSDQNDTERDSSGSTAAIEGVPDDLDSKPDQTTDESVSFTKSAMESATQVDRSPHISTPHSSGIDPVGTAIDAELASSSEDEGGTLHSTILSTDHRVDATDASPNNAQILDAKTRTLSLSSGSSGDSSSSSDDSEDEHDSSKDIASESKSTSIQEISKPAEDESQNGAGDPAISRVVGVLEFSALGKRKIDEPIPEDTRVPKAKSQKAIPANPEEPTQIMQTNSINPTDTFAVKSATTAAFALPGALHPRDAATLKTALSVHDGAAVDITYVVQTLTVFVKCVATHLRGGGNDVYKNGIVNNPGIVKLCSMIVNEHVRRNIPSDLLFEAMVRVFRTPRTRHAVEKSNVTLSSVFQHLLFQRLELLQTEDGGHEVCTKEMPVELHCFLHLLRNSIVPSRMINGLAFPQIDGKDAVISSTISSIRTPLTVSQDNGFLSHVCGLYATICRELDRSDLSRILLLDLLQCHPNLKGLYCAYVMVQIDTSVLQKQWDSRGRERHSVLRAAMVNVLQSITAESRDKHEVIFRESAVSLLSSIAEWVDDPLVMLPPHGGVGGSPEEVIIDFAAMLWRDYVKPCIVSTDHRVFEVSLALEFLAYVYGESTIASHFSISSFVYTRDSGTASGENEHCASRQAHKCLEAAQIALLLGALARGILRAEKDHNNRLSTEKPFPSLYVCEVIAWMLEVSSDEEISGVELSTIIGEVAQLLIGVSTHRVWLKHRDEWLHKLLKLLPKRRLSQLSGQPLRQLRLLVTSARPFATCPNQSATSVSDALV